jgi:hypothetical protein
VNPLVVNRPVERRLLLLPRPRDCEQLSVGAGELVRAGLKLLKRREELFEPVENFGRFDRPEVEQATAAPGEKRGEKKKK